jgi:sec-independent protein translocase protein TatA
VNDVGLVLIVILILALIWRGPKTLPQLGKAFGRGVREARREAEDIRDDLGRRSDDEGDDRPASS